MEGIAEAVSAVGKEVKQSTPFSLLIIQNFVLSSSAATNSGYSLVSNFQAKINNSQRFTQDMVEYLRSKFQHLIYYDTETLLLKLQATLLNSKEKAEMLSLFKKKNRAIKKWRSRAWSIDPKKTRLTILKAKTPRRHVPPWIYKKHFILG